MSHRIIRAYFIPALFAFLALSGLLAAQDPSPQEILKIVEQKRWQDLPASIICPADNSEMLLVPGGEFLMGVPADSPHAGKIADSSPEHMVRLDPYYIDRHEITNEQYARYLAATGAKPSSFAGEARLNGPRQPVVGVRYSDAESYAGWAKKRLPTEAEWEMAARGTDGRLYPWGSVFDPKRCNSYSNGRLEPENVGSYPLGASPYGLMDMAGNVAEWVYDAYSKDYYKESPIVNPRGPAERGNNFIVRGGDYKGEPHEITTFVRKPMNAVSAFRSIGFRCAVSAADLGAL
ncbi:MAG TPA: SUMF1/EgtB/PvdO family nonheme iron enzyme, partial [Candidatus Sumerlaeota bacterium]|nr:SUMF1/EgtB/PvdO family nonheme iron enzyme [Candidatus Sumerlaeota bacterium]